MNAAKDERAQDAEARRLMRALPSAALGALMEDGAPYVSLVLTACDADASPLMLLSDLAQHSLNIARDSRVSLLFDGTGGLADPLTGARLSLIGRAARFDDARARARYVARHPSAVRYESFADFHLYRVEIERGHLVAGFGRIHWVERDALWVPGAEAIAEAEADILDHMNGDHAEAVQLYAARLLGRAGEGWRMTGVDPDGIDLMLGGETGRLDFARPALDAQAVRAELVAMARQARGLTGGEG